MRRPWFDAHLDLAYLAVNGRDMMGPLDRAAGPHPPAAVTLPELADAGVRFALATIFTQPVGPGEPAGPERYPAGDADGAFAAGRAQLAVYQSWVDAGALDLGLTAALSARPRRGDVPESGPLRAGILVENADPIRSHDDLAWWVDRGVIAIGLAWSTPSRYAGGNSVETGLTDAGRDLVREMDRLGVVHDVSHLSDRSLAELMSLSSRPLIASHSNSRAILRGPPAPRHAGLLARHLADETIREISRRGGVVGLNLYSSFLRPGLGHDEPGRATIDDAIRHVEHAAGLAGHRRCVGLGSDIDGGFSADRLPEGLDRASDLARLAEALARRGWTDAEIDGFAWANWAEFWARSGPAGP